MKANFFKLEKMLVFLLTSMTFLCASTLYAQNQVAKVTPADTWYYEYLPADYNSNTDDYPIMFFFHGLGERGNSEGDLTKVAKNGPPLHVKNGTDFPFILISPQLKTNLGNWPPNYMDEVVEHILQSDLRIDLNRIYISGLSLGGGGAWFYAQRFPDKIAAVAPVCGSRNNTNEACDIAAENIPVWAFHGDADGTVSVNKTINMVDAINACVPAINPTAKITIYEGVGHNSWSRAYKTDNSLHTPNIYEWFMLQSRASISVNAGADKTVNLPTSTVNITATINSAKTISTKQWTKVSGPSGATLQNATSNTLTVNNLVQGIYNFRFSVTDVDGGAAADDIEVTVVSTNTNPVANAGPNRQIQLPTNSATINGSGSDADGSITNYLWIKISGGAATLTNTDRANLNVSDLVEGNYVFELEVTDDKGATSTDQMEIAVLAAANASPESNAGPDRTLQLPTNTINLVGGGSDPDGTIQTYLWQKVSGGAATITNAGQSTATVSGLQAGIYEFRLTVTDDDGASDSDKMQLTVSAANQVPQITLTKSVINLTLPTSSTTLGATITDADGTIASSLWEQQSGPLTANISNSASRTTSVTGLTSAGTYIFKITAVDNQGASNSANVTINVANEPVNSIPTVSAGADKFLTLPVNTLTINGVASDDDGSIASLVWTKEIGPSATLGNINTLNLSLSNLREGTYKFRLTATDDDGASNFDDVQVFVAPEDVNAVPTVTASSDQEITLPKDSTSFTAVAVDADGSIATYLWSQASGPSSATLIGAATAELKVKDLTEGLFVFSINVEDNEGAQASDEVSVLVGAQNIPPVVNAGNDVTVSIPLDSVQIAGSATDNDGSIVSFAWSQLSGPSSPTILYPDSSLLKVKSLVSGNYIFRLQATDDDGESNFDDVKVTVNEADNLSPVVSAGEDVDIQLPNNSVNLSANISDTDGTIASILWTQDSGPSQATLTNESTTTVTISELVEGTYNFFVTATDDDGAQGFDEVSVVVLAEAQNIPPVLSVENTQTISLPTNTVILEGIATDNDGSISSYLWRKISGPSAVLTNSNTTALTLSELVAGSYVFELSVTDDDGASTSARIQVFVLPADVNQSPVANAGPNKLIILPQAVTTVIGTGTDNDGAIISYLWEKLSGPEVTLQNVQNSTLTVTNLLEGEVKLKLTVMDNDSALASDDMILSISNETVNLPPNADAGPNLSTILPINTLTLNGTGADQDGVIINYLWTKVSGPSATLTNASTPTLVASNLSEGVYAFQLSVTDDAGARDTDIAIVNVFSAETNQAPAVSAGPDRNLQLPANTITLTATANDADGTIVSMLWEKISGGNAILANQTTSVLNLSGLEAGEYQFRFTAEDNDGVSESDEMVLLVNAEDANQSPTVNAGVDKTIQLPTNSIALTATASDPEGGTLSIRWSKVNGPTATLSNSTELTANISNMQAGNYVYKVTVTDEGGLTAEDQVAVVVLDETLITPPEVNAGTVTTVQLPVDEAVLVGTVSSEGTIESLLWEQIDGPEVAILSGVNTLTLNISALKEGVYTFSLTATDNGGQSATDETEVIVYPEEEVFIPEPPTLQVDQEIVVQLPATEVEVVVDAISPEGLITNYAWNQLTGPTTLVISPDSASVVQISEFVEGVYYLSIAVTDAYDSIVSKNVRLTVLGEDELAKPRKVFSPNGDGIDDTWLIEGSDALSGCQINVLDRQGRVVFSAEGYSDPWNGQRNDGTEAPAGLYFYIISCSASSNEIKGAITLVR